MTGEDVADSLGEELDEALPEKLLQLVYVSAGCVPFDEEQLEELLSIARSNNHSLDVTGVLLFQDDTFFQVLEGVPDVVEGLYKKISRDSRHNNVLLLVKREIEERNFSEWRMGFVRDREEIQRLPGFVDFFGSRSSRRTFIDLHGDSERMSEILDGFRLGKWRREPATN